MLEVVLLDLWRLFVGFVEVVLLDFEGYYVGL
jgi:hypothetical protein